MRTDVPLLVKLEEYTPYPYEIENVRLHFDLSPDKTIVKSWMSVRRGGDLEVPMELDGDGLVLRGLMIDSAPVPSNEMEAGDTKLTLLKPPATFELYTEVEIAPSANTALSGLYMSGGRFCTQCEAIGFRRITWWPDRPDVMSKFTVRLEADKNTYPVLLSNGSPQDAGDLDTGRHFAVWDDPHRKPSYLFALCAGDYDIHTDSFTTMSGRHVDLAIHVDKGEAGRAAWAMDCLKRSMKWDEDVFGREYDLDVFNIVAVRDFNFGAMENKGLNIFNSAYVLADEETATDADFEAIESIVAHEYFHNWTGNRITCRDWFQLCLKEGLTVFRDQEFSADMRSRPVQRIKDVIRLRARQFAEDAGPLAHAVRPVEYGSIENLYTATVYEKGAELIRMLKRLIGADAFSKGMQIYFDRHDGDAATIEDFYACFEDASGENLQQFLLWYAQAGTPALAVREDWDDAAGTFTATFSQSTPATPNQPNKAAVPIPLATALLDESGAELEAIDMPLSDPEFVYTRIGLAKRPSLSVARGFSAPVRLDREMTDSQQLELAAIETDPFNRWDLLQGLLKQQIVAATYKDTPISDTLIATLADTATSAAQDDPAFAALILRLPSVGELFQEHAPADPSRLTAIRRAIKSTLAAELAPLVRDTLERAAPAPFRPDAKQAGIRALRGSLMDLAAHNLELSAGLPSLYANAQSMTEQLSSLGALVLSPAGGADALAAFYDQWKDQPLVIDKWFALQARTSPLEDIEALQQHPDFDLTNPNRVRALGAHFGVHNLGVFHREDGLGYNFLAGLVCTVDPINPAVAARLLSSFEQWRILSPNVKDKAEHVLNDLSESSLSQNCRDILHRILS